MGIILKIIMLKARAYSCGCYPSIYSFVERENQVGQETEPVLDVFINIILCGKTPCTMTHLLLFSSNIEQNEAQKGREAVHVILITIP